ncbi:Double-stranded RNA-binding domain-containing protein [Dioscorea alata]|uniref:Double-stranded RNA-binding domain-containing protein n=1 Tax=Dioscorea alata TaxID=55571 RepID=A0ACB7WAP2_DIOAL|nr:Double-stranded RNA-binding domain-containing protein [Dioscorea alata]
MAAAASDLDGMDPAEEMTMEEVIHALTDQLVLPLLPCRNPSKEPPLIPQQEAVAKQLHAVVLLYNYYHRKQFPQLEFVQFAPFCKAVIVANPSLMIYMKYIHGREVAELEDFQKNLSILSITEKAVLDACKISAALDAGKDVPSIEGLPVSKIALFLVNPVKKTCLLQFSAVTQGVWSLLEKDVDAPLDNLGGSKNKKNSSADNDIRQKLAFSAAQKITGIHPSKLRILGCHLTYSLSEEKRTTTLYIMEYNQAVDGDFVEVPIDDVMNSIRGPLVRAGVPPEVTTVVEYYHFLPYVHIISEWLSRDPPHRGSLDLQKQQAEAEKFPLEPEPIVRSHMVSNKSCKNTQAMVLSNNISKTETESRNKRKNNPFYMNGSQEAAGIPKKKAGSFSSKLDSSNLQQQPMTCGMSLNNKKEMMKTQVINDQGIRGSTLSESSEAFSRPENEADGPIQQPFLQTKERIISDIQTNNTSEQLSAEANVSIDSDGFKDKADKVDVAKRLNNDTRTEDGGLPVQKDNEGASSIQDRMATSGLRSSVQDRLATSDPRSSVRDRLATSDLPIVPVEGCSEKNEMRISLLQTTLRTFKRKRNELCNQHRILEDEIAKCEMNIQNLLNGGEEDVVSNMEPIADAVTILSSSQMSMDGSTASSEEESLDELIKRKKLSEAVLFLRTPCQELDDICSKNNWTLPRYSVLPVVSGGNFQSTVTVQGVDFDCMCRGDPEEKPRDARQSAASDMLIKLRKMASQTK